MADIDLAVGSNLEDRTAIQTQGENDAFKPPLDFLVDRPDGGSNEGPGQLSNQRLEAIRLPAKVSILSATR